MAIQFVTLALILFNLLLEIGNALSYRRRVHELSDRVAALESMLGGSG